MGGRDARVRLELLVPLELLVQPAVQSSERYRTVSGEKELDLVDLLTGRARLQLQFYWRGRSVLIEGGNFYGSLPCETHESFGYGFREYCAVAQGILVRDGEMGCPW